VKILPDELWRAVKAGELNGFSFAGRPGEKVPAKVSVRQAKRLIGETEKSSDTGPVPPHSHEVNLAFDERGRIVPTNTEESLGHTHPVQKATATDRAIDHSHRMILIEND
jgi:hypothetical protein